MEKEIKDRKHEMVVARKHVKEDRIEVLKLSDLEMKQALGHGSYGQVFLVKDNDSNSFYALKRLHKQLILDKKQVKSVFNERDILKAINHPFIIKFYKR